MVETEKTQTKEIAGATVLIVDDSAENVTLLSRILKMSGYGVETVDNGARAIEMAKRWPPDLILLDINMPLMDGFETCSHLRADERTKDIPVIFISAIDSVEDKVKAFRLGGIDYILKPFDYEEVQSRVETHLVLRRLRVQLEQTNQELAKRVDELTRSQSLLAERERKLSAFVEALPNLAFILDEQGYYLEVMATETSLLIAKPADLIGKSVEDVMPPKEGAKIVDAIQQTIEKGGIQIIEYKIPVLAGGEHWFEGRIACMEKDDYGHGKVVLIASEITERVHLYQQVQRLANEDVLTGCNNRRHFMAVAAQEIQRSMRYKRPLSLLMVDVDHFKNFNDRYGHQVGDLLLCHLVNLCQKELRVVDILGRYGGDEFVILMPETARAGAGLAAVRLLSKIQKMKVKTREGNLSITVSMGLSSLERGFDDTMTLDGLVKSADDALYIAKKEGRNCIREG
jgi:two-component system cell cycle response regulator